MPSITPAVGEDVEVALNDLLLEFCFAYQARHTNGSEMLNDDDDDDEEDNENRDLSEVLEGMRAAFERMRAASAANGGSLTEVAFPLGFNQGFPGNSLHLTRLVSWLQRHAGGAAASVRVLDISGLASWHAAAEAAAPLRELAASLPPGVTQVRLGIDSLGSAYQTFGLPSAVVQDGKVCYEIVFEVVGECPQIGWVTPAFKRVYRHSGKGVGDDENGWGADGKQKLKRHDGSGEPWSTAWKDGDVVGVAADLPAGTLLFAKNGDWETVFCDVQPASGLFPAITTQGASYAANFGADPFRFSPPDGTFVP
eukprot:gene12720-638_t